MWPSVIQCATSWFIILASCSFTTSSQQLLLTMSIYMVNACETETWHCMMESEKDAIMCATVHTSHIWSAEVMEVSFQIHGFSTARLRWRVRFADTIGGCIMLIADVVCICFLCFSIAVISCHLRCLYISSSKKLMHKGDVFVLLPSTTNTCL
jgi:hypothetical protein